MTTSAFIVLLLVFFANAWMFCEGKVVRDITIQDDIVHAGEAQIAVPFDHFGKSDALVGDTFELVRIDDRFVDCSGCSYEGPDLNGSVVISYPTLMNCEYTFCGSQRLARSFKEKNARGFIMCDVERMKFPYTPGSDARILYPGDTMQPDDLSDYIFLSIGNGPLSDIWDRIPLMDGEEDFFSSQARVTIRLQGVDRNPWKTLWDDGPWGIFQVIFACVSIILISLSGWRLYVFVSENGGFALEIPQAALGMELIGNILRFFFYLDPLWCRFFYRYESGSLLVTAFVPFGFISIVLVLVMFRNLLVESGLPQPFSLGPRTKWLIASFTFFVFVLDLSMNIARSFFGFISQAALMVTGGMIGCSQLAIAGTFFYFGARGHVDAKSTERERKRISHIRVAGIFMILATTGTFAAGIFIMHAWGRFAAFLLAHIGYNGVSFYQIRLFRPPSSPYPPGIGKIVKLFCQSSKKVFPKEMADSYSHADTAGYLRTRRTTIISNRAVSVWGLRHFVKKYHVDVTMTTGDVVDRIIKPATAAEGFNGFIDTMKSLRCDETGESFVGPTDHFVSHAWKYSFSTLLDALENVQRGSKRTIYFWLDIFAINQHRTGDAGQLPDLDKPLLRCRSLLMVLTPWSNPVPLQRVWCLWELLKAIQADADIQMVFPEEEERNFFRALHHDHKKVVRALTDISVEKAEASVDADKFMIQALIQKDMGCLDDVERVVSELGLITDRIKAKKGDDAWKPSWLDMQADDFYLKKSAVGYSASLQRNVIWSYGAKQIRSDDADNSVIFDLREGFRRMDVMIKTKLEGTLRSVAHKRSFRF